MEQQNSDSIEASTQGSAIAATDKPRGGKRRRENSAVKEYALIILYAILIAFLLKTFVVRGFYIPSSSMEDTLQINDRVFVNVAGGLFTEAERGDIVVFKDTQGWMPVSSSSNPVRDALAFVGIMPDGSSNYLVKRVIGVGGDHLVGTVDGRISVNGVEIDETYLKPGVRPTELPFDVIVPQNSYFVMGDNRSNSADSRYHIQTNTEFINDADVVGEVFVVAWPISNFTFVGGDNDVFASVPATE
ncbi:MAG: signal peptidase I [Rothia sp. (in: high G+C Gram-positive bacteria)]|nr:signal peptidase I [Rothia sp. (in: high G+C Gram-positive bacteria)]